MSHLSRLPLHLAYLPLSSLRLELNPFGIDITVLAAGSVQTNILSTARQPTTLAVDEDKNKPYYPNLKEMLEIYANDTPRETFTPVEVFAEEVVVNVVAVGAMKAPAYDFRGK